MKLIKLVVDFLKNKIVTIDGPAASGKEKISKFISYKWRLKHLDSGILYRRLAHIFLNENVNLNDVDEIKKKLKKISEISYRNHKNIRTEQISNISSKIAVYVCVRNLINRLQYDFVKKIKILKDLLLMDEILELLFLKMLI